MVWSTFHTWRLQAGTRGEVASLENVKDIIITIIVATSNISWAQNYPNCICGRASAPAPIGDLTAFPGPPSGIYGARRGQHSGQDKGRGREGKQKMSSGKERERVWRGK